MRGREGKLRGQERNRGRGRIEIKRGRERNRHTSRVIERGWNRVRENRQTEEVKQSSRDTKGV